MDMRELEVWADQWVDAWLAAGRRAGLPGPVLERRAWHLGDAARNPSAWADPAVMQTVTEFIT